jgi:glycerol-3-phosphate acyltransferase PlsY
MVRFIYFILFFLIGSIPFGWIIYKLTEKKDIRKEGSGNIGAANVYRLKGKFYGVLVLLLDASKGVISLILSKYLFRDQLFWALSAFFVVSGHIFSPFLSFKGGKGVATSMGALAILSFKTFIIAIFPVLAILFSTRIVSISSLTFSILYPILFILLEKSLTNSIPIFLISLLIFARHKENIVRIIEKRERRIEI